MESDFDLLELSFAVLEEKYLMIVIDDLVHQLCVAAMRKEKWVDYHLY